MKALVVINLETLIVYIIGQGSRQEEQVRRGCWPSNLPQQCQKLGEFGSHDKFICSIADYMPN